MMTSLFQHFPGDAWLPRVLDGWSSLTIGLSNSISAHGHDFVFFSQGSKLQGKNYASSFTYSPYICNSLLCSLFLCFFCLESLCLPYPILLSSKAQEVSIFLHSLSMTLQPTVHRELLHKLNCNSPPISHYLIICLGL